MLSPKVQHLHSAPVLSGERILHPVARAVFGIPLFLKVLVANVVLVLMGVGMGVWFTVRFVAMPDGSLNWSAVWLMVAAGFAGSVLLNGIVLSLALQPLYALERIVDLVAGGDLSARAKRVLFTDPDVERLADTLNHMLDVVEADRQQLQKLSEQVLTAQEDERKRIARELHDETAQSLTTVLIRLKMLERARDADQLREQIHDLRDLAADTLEGVRKLAVDLRPSTLDNLGLVAALEAYTEGFTSRLPIAVQFNAAGFAPDQRLPDQVELVLYRVVQESLTNVAKHAGATCARVSLQREPDRVVATVTDDGHGFDVEEMMRTRERGLGLFGMQERLALVRGRLAIECAPGTGTTVQAIVPTTDGTRIG